MDENTNEDDKFVETIKECRDLLKVVHEYSENKEATPVGIGIMFLAAVGVFVDNIEERFDL